MNKNNVKLTSEIKKLKLSNYVKLLGQSNKISQVMNGIDIHVLSSSYGEGFPNVVAEAMSCGTPCIVTDVISTFCCRQKWLDCSTKKCN